MRAPMVIRWPGAHQAGHGQERHLRVARLAAHVRQHRRRPQGRWTQEEDRGRHAIPGSSRRRSTASIRPTTCRERPEKSARDTFFYYSSSHPSAVRYKNWKMYFAIAPETATGLQRPGSPDPVRSRHGQPQARSIRDDDGASEKKANFWFAGALAGPVTAYIYDWNLLPIGQVLWLKELETYMKLPADAGSGELQPGSGHGSAQERADAPEPVARLGFRGRSDGPPVLVAFRR